MATEAATQKSTTTNGDANEIKATFDLSNPHNREEAYGVYDRLRDEGPVSKVRFVFGPPADEPEAANQGAFFFRPDTWLVTQYDEGVEAMLDNRFTVDHTKLMTPEQRAAMAEAAATTEETRVSRALRRNLLTLDPPDHTRLRKLVQPSFTASAMASLTARVQRIADDLLDAAEREAAARGESAPDRTMELVRAFAYPLPVTVISEMVGIPLEDRARARYWTENLLQSQNADPEVFADTRARIEEFGDYLIGLFERRRREPADDLITRLVQAEEDGDKLSQDEMLSMVFIVYVAGFVTTVNLIGNGVVALLTHPEQLAAFRANPDLASNVVEETLRYWGPAETTLPRTATMDIEIGGTTVARGEQMRAGLASMDRDPARFVNPDAYDISRADANRHVGFGKGIHVCLGAPLARLEGKIAFETLFRRYPDLRLAVPAEEVEWSTNAIRGFAAIPLLF